MRQPDDFPIDPDVLAELEAIDATLAGEPVDPAYAEIAEVALLVAAERPVIRPAFAAELDGRLEQRFRREPGESAPGSRASAGGGKWSRLRSAAAGLAWWQAGGGFAAALAATVAVVIAVGAGGSGGHPQLRDELNSAPGIATSAASAPATATSTTSATAAATTPSTPSLPGRGAHVRAGAPRLQNLAAKSAAAPASHGSLTPKAPGTLGPLANAPAPAAATAASSASAAGGVQPQSNGRKQIQSAQLSLMAAPSRLDVVAQEAFDVIGANRGIVNHSTVTAGGSGGYADIRISVPSQNLAQTMTQLSELRYGHVLSRTDMSQDVNDRYLVDVRSLADAKALRTSLLKQLAAATTQAQIDSLNAQIHDAESSIHSDETTLDSLNKQINLSQIDLTINPGVVPVPAHHHRGSSGFTLHRALHDAGRVLVVVAGVGLIGLAAFVPIALLLALTAWIVFGLRRRGRESALDAS
jgi:hypothetical protein